MKFLDLPDDLVALVASQAPVHARAALSITCRALRSASRSSAWWRDRSMYVRLRDYGCAMSFLWWLADRRLTELLELRVRFLRAVKVPSVFCELAASAPRLETLVLLATSAHVDLGWLHHLTSLRRLCVSAKDCAVIFRLRMPASLEKLTLRNVSADCSLKAWPPRLKRLTANDVGFHMRKSISGPLTQLRGLASLDLAHDSYMSWGGPPPWSELTSLHRLRIGDAAHPDQPAPWVSLRRLPNLRQLEVLGNWCPARSAMQLEHLTVQACSNRGDWFWRLPHLTRLTSLEVLEYRSYGDDRRRLTLLPPASLEELHVAGPTAPAAAEDSHPWLALSLAQCSRLRRLDLDRVTLLHCPLVPALRHVCVYDCDLGPGQLAKLPEQLESVCVQRCTVSLRGGGVRAVLPGQDVCAPPGALVHVQNLRGLQHL